MTNKFKVCTVVQGKTLETFLNNLKKAQGTANMIELRADSICDIRLENIGTLRLATELPSIFTYRHESEGGLYSGTIKKQTEFLKKAFDSGFKYVDASIGNPILTKLTIKEKKQLLLSYHNMTQTPDLTELEAILLKMRPIKPAIIKIATLVREAKDITTLTKLLSERNRNEKMVVIGMGEMGSVTRTSFLKLGSYITFVQMKGEESIARGMLTIDELNKTL